MNRIKVQQVTSDLKVFFIKKGLTISEAKETIYRLLDYIDQNYDTDERDIPFKNGNIFKDKKPIKGIKLEGMDGIRSRVN